jgi:plastocyanin
MKLFSSAAVFSIVLLPTFALAGEVTGKVQGVSDLDNVVVFIDKAPGTFKPPTEHAVMDQKHMAFVPHVLPVVSGTSVDFPNSDTVRHNIFSPSKELKFNLGLYPSGVTKTEKFDIPGPTAISLLCAIHTQLSGFIFVAQNPYFAMANADGTYKISGVPAGSYTVKAWHDGSAMPATKVTVGASPATANLTIEGK